MIVLLSISLNICLGCSKEQSQWDDSFGVLKGTISMRRFFWAPIAYWLSKKKIWKYSPLLSKVLTVFSCAFLGTFGLHALSYDISDFIWPFLRPYMGVIPNPKMAFIFPISCILALIFPILIKYFPKCVGKGSFPKSQIKSLDIVFVCFFLDILYIRTLSWKHGAA